MRRVTAFLLVFAIGSAALAQPRLTLDYRRSGGV
jgi:hypothetical protein